MKTSLNEAQGGVSVSTSHTGLGGQDTASVDLTTTNSTTDIPHEGSSGCANGQWSHGLSENLAEALLKFLNSDRLVLRWIRLLCCFLVQKRPLVESALEVCHRWTEHAHYSRTEHKTFIESQESVSRSMARLISHIGRAPGGRVHRLRKYMDWHQRFPLPYFELNQLYAAAFFNYTTEITRLRKIVGMDVNLQVGVSTSLIYAACGESPEAIEQLLEEGVNINHISRHEDDSALARSYEIRRGGCTIETRRETPPTGGTIKRVEFLGRFQQSAELPTSRALPSTQGGDRCGSGVSWTNFQLAPSSRGIAS